MKLGIEDEELKLTLKLRNEDSEYKLGLLIIMTVKLGGCGLK